MRTVVSKNLTLAYRFFKFFKLNKFTSSLNRNSLKPSLNALFVYVKSGYYSGWGVSFIGLNFVNYGIPACLHFNRSLQTFSYKRVLAPVTRNLFKDAGSCISLEITRHFESSVGKNILSLCKLLGLRVDFLSFANKKVLDLLVTAQQRIFVFGEYFVRSQTFFLKNLYSDSTKHNYSLYKRAYSVKKLKTTQFNLGVDLTFWFRPSLKLPSFFFKEILFLNTYLFTGISFNRGGKTLITRNVVVQDKNTLTSFSLQQNFLELPIHFSTSNFFSRGLIDFWYTKYITNWLCCLTTHMRTHKKRLYSRKKKVLHFVLNLRVRAPISVNRFCIGKMRRLRKTIGILPLLSAARLAVIGTYGGYSNILAIPLFSNAGRAFIDNKHYGLKSLVGKSTVNANNLQSFLQPINTINPAYCMGYFLKFSYYLLNYRRITSVVFGGTFYK